MRVTPRLVPALAAHRVTPRARVAAHGAGGEAGADAPVAGEVLEPAPRLRTLPFTAQHLGQEWLPPAPEIDPARAIDAYRRRSDPPLHRPRLRAVA